ncbi:MULTISPECIES: SDR family NAD(P)-dependent oxidoreductase [Rhodomicrobium]|uniref:SDR family NAD(P)-dependent oxidoreductase n=1 Tax=Rhodomicrobium TaxID=1068 RepID=UPI000B4ABB13|nr:MULTISPECIES: SDR family NAD(P)-dependent oxidoreductase [Rhodomicrobium]
MLNSILTSGRTAVITGAASGIGLAAARRFAALGMNVVLADLPGAALEAARSEVEKAAKGGGVLAVPTDVSHYEQVEKLRDQALAQFGDVAVLMNNAAIGAGDAKPWQDAALWHRVIDVNLMGVVHGVTAFTEGMIARKQPGLIINTGSKQGITNPPGAAAYNASKAAVRSLTEQLAFALSTEAPHLGVHLLIPGWVHTGLTGAAGGKPKPDGAWTPDQLIDFMIESLERGDFYILCPDNAVARPVDERRMQWMADDLIKNRPALSRWREDHKDAFARFMAE